MSAHARNREISRAGVVCILLSGKLSGRKRRECVMRKPICHLAPAGPMLLAAALLAGVAVADEIEMNADITLTHGLTWRVQSADTAATSPNSDDGTRNYDTGIVSNTSSVAAEFEVSAGTIDIFARTHAFIDYENQHGSRDHMALTDAAKDVAGRDFRLLDLYAATTVDAGDMPVDLRIGNQVLNWGESTFIRNGINVINPFDVSRLRTPGSELRDGLVPVPMVSAAFDPSANLSLEGFYQFLWQKTELDPSGTYFSQTDYVGAGGTRAFLVNDGVTDQGRTFGPLANAINGALQSLPYYSVKPHEPHFLSVQRQADQEPDNGGQWGVALRYYAEELNDTEFGFYYSNVHSRLPLLSGEVATSGQLQQSLGIARAASALTLPEPRRTQLAGALAIDHFASLSRYLIVYPENLQTFGLSFNTALGTTGWALQGEYSYHPDAPLQREERSLFTEALSPLTCALNPATRDTAECRAAGQAILGKRLKGWVERDVSQVQVTGTRIFGSMMGSDSTGFIAEAAVSHVHDMPDKSVTPLQSGGRGLADATSWGYQGALWLDYNNAIGAATLTPYLRFQHDVSGNSPGPAGPFVDGRTVVTLGANIGYLARWEADLSYTRHSGRANRLADRDFIMMSFSYSF